MISSIKLFASIHISPCIACARRGKNYIPGLYYHILFAPGKSKFIKISSDPGFGKAMDLNVNTLISIVQANWKNILSNNTLLKLLYSAILTLGGSLFYKRRELI
jgi:hypothetical protein